MPERLRPSVRYSICSGLLDLQLAAVVEGRRILAEDSLGVDIPVADSPGRAMVLPIGERERILDRRLKGQVLGRIRSASAFQSPEQTPLVSRWLVRVWREPP